MKVTTSVPASSGSTPKCAGWNNGAQFVPVKKSTGETARKKSSAGRISAMTMPTVVNTETSAASPRIALMMSSPILRRRTPRLGRAWAWTMSPAAIG